MKLEPELADALGQAGGGANNGADASADNHRSEKEEKEQRTQAGILIKLAKRFGLSLFRTPDADGYADIKVKEHRETWPLRSSGFRKWLRQIYFFEEKSAPNKEALESAVETLDAEAQFSCETTHPVELRVAYHDFGLEDRPRRACSLPLHQHVTAAGYAGQGRKARRPALVSQSQE